MIPDPQAQAVMLLTVSFGKSDSAAAKPLSVKEWARFAVWLKDHDLEPSALLRGDTRDLLSDWTDESIPLSRLEGLLDRGGALGFALEKWERTGLWFVTRSDPDYPMRLKRKLRSLSPPLLFGCGNRKLLGRGGIAVVGSRDASQDDLAFAESVGGAAAIQGHSIVSGGARGVDQNAMLGALGNEGTVVGVMSNGLLRAATSARYRNHLLSGDLTLITPFNPDAGFNVGNAMSRNRYIYCLADAAVVVSSTSDNGGTWNGAIENLKASWVPLWVKRTASAQSGNPDLVRQGAHWLPDRLTSLEFLLDRSPAGTAETAEAGRTGPPAAETEHLTVTEPDTGTSDPPDTDRGLAETRLQATDTDKPVPESAPGLIDTDLYARFLIRLLDVTAGAPMKAGEIALHMNLETAQVNAWLKRGVNDGKIKKLAKPVRYQSSGNAQRSDFYAWFLTRMLDMASDGPMKAEEIALRTNLEKSQVTAWLKRGVNDGKIRKLTKPVRYQSSGNLPQQTSLFGKDG